MHNYLFKTNNYAYIFNFIQTKTYYSPGNKNFKRMHKYAENTSKLFRLIKKLIITFPLPGG